jgi:hypothetical protein
MVWPKAAVRATPSIESPIAPPELIISPQLSGPFPGAAFCVPNTGRYWLNIALVPGLHPRHNTAFQPVLGTAAFWGAIALCALEVGKDLPCAV